MKQRLWNEAQVDWGAKRKVVISLNYAEYDII